MDLGADIFIGANTPPDTLRTAFARAYDVPVNRVAIRRSQTAWPLADVVLEYVSEDAPVPGDYPIQILPWGPADRTDEPATLTALAVALGVPVLTSADDDNDLLMDLYLPDGTTHGVLVDQDDDGGIRNTPEMRRLIASHVAAIAVASQFPPSRSQLVLKALTIGRLLPFLSGAEGERWVLHVMDRWGMRQWCQ